jgi:hypothetical protein
MKILDERTETRYRHEVVLDVRDTRWLETRERIPFRPDRLTIVWEHRTGYPLALTTVTLEGPQMGAPVGERPPIVLKYAAAMVGKDPAQWATEETWQTRYQRLPEWVRWLVADYWPTDF